MPWLEPLNATGEANMKLDPSKLLALKVPSAGAAKVGEPVATEPART
jgi:hypothetical protein